MAGTAFYERITQEDLNTGILAVTKRNPAGGVLSATQINLSTFALNQISVSTSWTPGLIAAGGYATQSLAVTGANLGYYVVAALNVDLQGLQLSAYVSSSGQVTAVLYNLTGAGVDLGAPTLKVAVFLSK